MDALATWWANTSVTEIVWLTVGFTAQLMFSMRFILQWIASERAQQSIVPEVFWYFSFAGGLMLFAYAIYRGDPVFILGQGTGLMIYARNIHFIWREKMLAEEQTVSEAVSKMLANTVRRTRHFITNLRCSLPRQRVEPRPVKPLQQNDRTTVFRKPVK